MKALTCYINRKKLANLLNKMETHFWQVKDYENEILKTEVKKIRHFFWLFGTTYIIGAALLSFGFFMKPLLNNEKQVPLICWLPDGNASPYYEIAYLAQFHILFSVVVIVGGFDIFYASINLGLCTQFKMLRYELEHLVGREHKETAINLKRCVEHHQFLLEYLI